MGELYPASKVSKPHVPSINRIGYTGQETFIMPGTLRENILFGCEYEETLYDSVIEACSLKVDFS
jgi:ABC-type transport system involved in cytochrome bd biosynthesis fused ATPase/permease subunit